MKQLIIEKKMASLEGLRVRGEWAEYYAEGTVSEMHYEDFGIYLLFSPDDCGTNYHDRERLLSGGFPGLLMPYPDTSGYRHRKLFLIEDNLVSVQSACNCDIMTIWNNGHAEGCPERKS